jgi:hypothetical protein
LMTIASNLCKTAALRPGSIPRVQMCPRTSALLAALGAARVAATGDEAFPTHMARGWDPKLLARALVRGRGTLGAISQTR